jgi:hypothetical protein
MHVRGQPIGVDGVQRGGQALSDELTAVGPLSVGPAGRTDPGVLGFARPQFEQFEERAHPAVSLPEPVATAPDWVSRPISSGLIPSHSLSTAAVWSPSAGAATAGG